jgi:hypothetical protein
MRHVSGAVRNADSKWAALKASVESRNIILVFFICFGSATTSFYWTKWLGKLIARSSKPPVKDITKTNEMISLGVHTVLMIAICALFPLVSQIYVDPLVTDMFGSARQVIPTGVLYLLVLLILFFFAVPGLCVSPEQTYGGQPEALVYERNQHGQ